MSAKDDSSCDYHDDPEPMDIDVGDDHDMPPAESGICTQTDALQV